jgi:hypothetical protein
VLCFHSDPSAELAKLNTISCDFYAVKFYDRIKRTKYVLMIGFMTEQFRLRITVIAVLTVTFMAKASANLFLAAIMVRSFYTPVFAAFEAKHIPSRRRMQTRDTLPPYKSSANIFLQFM